MLSTALRSLARTLAPAYSGTMCETVCNTSAIPAHPRINNINNNNNNMTVRRSWKTSNAHQMYIVHVTYVIKMVW